MYSRIMLNTFQFVKLYFYTLPIFLAIDGFWLAVIAKNFYGKHLGFFMAPKPNWLSAGIFYLGYVIGILIFAVNPALRESSLGKAVLLGALFGMFCYATYDLTNLATIKNWPWFITVIDIIWGSFVTALVAIAGYLIGRRMI